MVPDLCGHLKIQLGRSRTHLTVKLLHQLFNLRPGHQLRRLLVFLLFLCGIPGNGDQFAHLFLNGLRRNMVFLIIFLLNLPAAFCLVDRVPHGIGDAVGVHNDMTLRISRSTTDGLDQRGFRTEESLLIRVQNGNQRNFRNIQSLTEQVDADQHIKFVKSHVTDEFRPFQRVDVAVQIIDADPGFLQKSGEILRHSLGQRRHQNLVVSPGFLPYLSDQIINLSLRGTDLNLGIQKTCRPDDLLGAEHLMILLVLSGCGGNKKNLIDFLLKFLKGKRPVVESRRKPETVIDQRCLSRTVAGIHGADLRHRPVGLIDDDQIIVREEIHQRIRRFSRLQSGQVTAVVLNTRADAGLPEHLDIEVGPFFYPLCLQKSAV